MFMFMFTFLSLTVPCPCMRRCQKLHQDKSVDLDLDFLARADPFSFYASSQTTSHPICTILLLSPALSLTSSSSSCPQADLSYLTLATTVSISTRSLFQYHVPLFTTYSDNINLILLVPLPLPLPPPPSASTSSKSCQQLFQIPRLTFEDLLRSCPHSINTPHTSNVLTLEFFLSSIHRFNSSPLVQLQSPPWMLTRHRLTLVQL